MNILINIIILTSMHVKNTIIIPINIMSTSNINHGCCGVIFVI